jgi:hypothetical protein
MSSLGSPIILYVANVDGVFPQKRLISLSFLIFDGFNGEMSRRKNLLISVRNKSNSLHCHLQTFLKVNPAFHPVTNVGFSPTGKAERA